jgi:adenylate cyclase, class 2
VATSGKAQKAGRTSPRCDGAGKEIEVKLFLSDPAAMSKLLVRLRARVLAGRVHEMNTLYDTSDGSLAAHGQLVRIRVETPAKQRCSSGPEPPGTPPKAVLTHKGPAQGNLAGAAGARYKVREEQESQIDDPKAMAKVFATIGLLPWFRYEKYRTTYALPGIPNVKVELDETPIGAYLELEGDPRAIDRAAKRLGFCPADYITKSYGALFMEQRGARRAGGTCEPKPCDRLPDMIFYDAGWRTD